MPAIQSAVVMAPANMRHVGAPLRQVRQVAPYGHISLSVMKIQYTCNTGRSLSWTVADASSVYWNIPPAKPQDSTSVTGDSGMSSGIQQGCPLGVMASPQISHLVGSSSALRQWNIFSTDSMQPCLKLHGKLIHSLPLTHVWNKATVVEEIRCQTLPEPMTK
jgi:hypothetical protein